jgi:hypothetical protein
MKVRNVINSPDLKGKSFHTYFLKAVEKLSHMISSTEEEAISS